MAESAKEKFEEGKSGSVGGKRLLFPSTSHTQDDAQRIAEPRGRINCAAVDGFAGRLCCT